MLGLQVPLRQTFLGVRLIVSRAVARAPVTSVITGRQPSTDGNWNLNEKTARLIRYRVDYSRQRVRRAYTRGSRTRVF